MFEYMSSNVYVRKKTLLTIIFSELNGHERLQLEKD